MKTFISQIFQAFAQSRHLQAERILQRHRDVHVPAEHEHDLRVPIEMTNLVAPGTAEAPAEFKLAA